MADPARTDRKLMRRAQFTPLRIRRKVKGILLAGMLVMPMGVHAVHAPAVKPDSVAATPAAPNKPDPDVLLIEIYKELAANHLRQAQQKADTLVTAYPNFQLGHLIRGDLLLMHTRLVNTLGAVDGVSEERLGNLRAEAAARLKSLRSRPDPNLVPRPLLKLREDQKFALLVDARRSRLYVYENRGGLPHFVSDYYISQGKLGVDKFREGDQKTPLGVYYITSQLPRQKLPDFYGSGALPISYPNDWDRLNGRGGSGIWLHGTPSSSYSRPPLASDGCVVLTNPDLDKLKASVEIGRTPVVISEQVEFVTREKWEADRQLAARLLENWRKDLESLNPNRLMANYSSRFKTERGENLETWSGRQKQRMSGLPGISVSLREVSFFLYPGQENLIVSTFTQDAIIGKVKHSVRKRQYWAKEGAGWKIIAENGWQSTDASQ
jgi:murein L,D-transpeptidase YafK